MNEPLTRRDWLTTASLAGLAGLGLTANAQAAQDRTPEEPFGYCFNTSTIMGQKLDIIEIVELIAKVGYTGIEPWISELDRFTEKGGNLRDLGNRIRDRGLKVESVIGFSEWAVDDPERRKKGLEDARRCMDIVQKIGGVRIAAPPAGATNQDLSLAALTERYGELLKVGSEIGVVPMVEVWGFSKPLRRLSEAMYVAIESGHPRACVLADVYHLYKGGSDFNGLKLLGPASMYVMHFNDYPASPPRAEIKDEHRVYPGDGIAPLKTILQTLKTIGFRGSLSLELFNREYWKRDPVQVAQDGLARMKAAVRAS